MMRKILWWLLAIVVTASAIGAMMVKIALYENPQGEFADPVTGAWVMPQVALIFVSWWLAVFAAGVIIVLAVLAVRALVEPRKSPSLRGDRRV
jgi:membrane protein implicated in regulation of membrane protease activity